MLQRFPSFLLCFSVSFCTFGILAGPFYLWDRGLWQISPAASYSLIAGAALFSLALILARFRISTLSLNEQGFALGLALVFFSDWLCRGYNLFQGPSIRGELILFSALWLLVLKSARSIFFATYALGSIALLVICFLWEAGGRTLFSDDHPTFIYRLSLLKDNFPLIPFYYPLWNGGLEARDFFATGVLNIFLIAAPIIYAFDVWHTYNYLVALVLFALLPLSAFLAARVQKLSPTAAAIAVILSLTSSLLWYRWGLKYGTLGFVTAAALAPLNLSLLLKLFSKEKELSGYEALLFAASMSLMLLWAPTALILIPFAVMTPFYLKTLLGKKYFKRICLSIAVLNIPWMTLLWVVSNVPHFLQAEKATHQWNERPDESGLFPPSDSDVTEIPARNPNKPPAAGSQPGRNIQDQPSSHATGKYRMQAGEVDLRRSLKVLRENSIGTNPLLIFLLLPGILMLAPRERFFMLFSSAWLAFLGAVVVTLKPQLEFDRLFLILNLCACLPVALLLERLAQSQAFHQRLLPALCFAFLLSGPFSTASVLLNRSVERYYFAEPIVEELSSAIKTWSGAGRVLFSGFILHHLSNGHIAPLTELSGKSLVASSPYHNIWQYQDVIPQSFRRRGEMGYEEYFDLLNVSAVVAHEKTWRDYFLNRPEKYELTWQKGSFMLFRRLTAPNNYFLRGSGEFIAQDSNSISIRAHTPEITLKFNYFPFLLSSACHISGEKVAPELTFIKLSACPEQQLITIRAVSPWKRLLIRTP